MHDEIIRDMGRYVVPGRTYPRPLPADLDVWYCYIVDSGHCIAATLVGREQDGLIPVPVRAVLRGYTMTPSGHVAIDLPYDPNLGLVTQPEDDEW